MDKFNPSRIISDTEKIKKAYEALGGILLDGDISNFRIYTTIQTMMLLSDELTYNQICEKFITVDRLREYKEFINQFN